MHKTLFIILAILSAAGLNAQKIPIDETGTTSILSPIGSAFNRIFNARDMDSFYLKLAGLKKNKKGTVRIVHIGDSHLQAGSLPGRVREQLQQYFGNAGRGLVFPYRVSKTNSPTDISSSSNSGWNINKVGSSPGAGISGFAIHTNSTGASIDMSVNSVEPGRYSFSRLRFFLDTNSTSSWILRAGNNITSYIIKNTADRKTIYNEIKLESPATGFLLSALPSGSTRSFFGVSLENDQPGILYHAVGVNGARYEQYNEAPLFWKQLPGLEADLYIISLGTNEAQRNSFDPVTFRKTLTLFIQKLRTASPNAAILVTTAADSYKSSRPNPVLRELNRFLFEYCTQNSLPVWDLYRVTNGYGSAYTWLRKGYMNPDLVHFTPEGYRLQGQLLFNAIARGYNETIDNRQ